MEAFPNAQWCEEDTLFLKDGFLFGGISPPNKKNYTLRPLRLSGENLISDKTDPQRYPMIQYSPRYVRA